MFDFKAPKFTNPEAAREYLEGIRWPNGPVCPHCGEMERVMLLRGKATRPGLYKCGECRKQFTVTVGTVFERSKISIEKWVLATHPICSSKKGMSAHQLHRMMGVTYKTAWFMCHRIREAIRNGGFAAFGCKGGAVEVDETFIGRAMSMVVDDLKISTVVPILKANIDRESHIMTDEAGQYTYLKKDFASHDFVKHGQGEYVRDEIHTNTIEGYFSIFKRGMKGVYQHCSKDHLHRYLAEFDHRYNYRENNGFDDSARTRQALKGIEGKRLTYLPINAQ